MKLTLPRIRITAIALSLVVASFAFGWWFGHRDFEIKREGIGVKVVDRSTPQDRSDVDFELFWEVWDTLESKYFDKSKVSSQEMVLGAIKGMVASLEDPYTVFLPPDEQKRTKEDLGGQFEGVGIQIGFKGSQLAVISPLDGTPAKEAGVEGGDFIIGIKDKNKDIEMGTGGMSLPDAVKIIRGPAGTPVILVVTREGVDQPFEIEIVRSKIDVPSIILSFEGASNEIAHLKLLRFGDQTNGEWDSAVFDIKNKKSKGVVLDLRNNPGGYLNGAVFVASEFVKRGVSVIQEDGKGNRQEFKLSGAARLGDIPLVVLVNGGSASASEIVAGALKDHSRAKVVGETTFGKGTIQEAQELDSSGLHITTARWLTPEGNWINSEGLEPDIAIEDDPATEEDEQLLEAIKLL
ncbi:peptidase S41 [Candidatus Woesebacteria bacterium]|nr:peptidase S41 [Candidatus Woesebacteria bacterium]